MWWSNAAAGCAHSIPLKDAYLAYGVADTPLHHFHSSECSRRRRSRILCSLTMPKGKQSEHLPIRLSQDNSTPFSAQALFNQATWIFFMHIFHIWVSALFGSTIGDTAGVFIPFPMGCIFPAPLPQQLPYGHASLQKKGEDVTHSTPCFCPSNASIICQMPPRASSLQFPSGNWLC